MHIFKWYKPSLLYNSNYEDEIYDQEEMNQLNKYPCLKKVIMYQQEQKIFFRTEEAKESFSQKIAILSLFNTISSRTEVSDKDPAYSGFFM